MSEAFVRLRETDAETFAQFPQAPRIIGFRNRLIHGYNAIDQEAVWDVVQRHLPTLPAAIEKILPPTP